MKEKEKDISLVRHSMSGYENIKGIVKGPTPEAPINYNEQKPDLTPKGIELARTEAEAYFDGLDPEKDEIFLASSSEARAIGTADIYRQVAKERGFKRIKPDHTGNDYAETVGEGEIRVIDTLSLNPKNNLLMTVYNPDPAKLFNVNWENVQEETKAKWEEARKIIEANDKGSWVANFAAHSQKIKEIFGSIDPKHKSAEELLQRNFKNIIRLVRFADNKIKQEGGGRNIKVLGFGHENYLILALEQYFDEHNINYCEAINFEVSPEEVIAEFRDKESVVYKAPKEEVVTQPKDKETTVNE